MKRSLLTQMPGWQRLCVIAGIGCGYLGVAVFGVAAMMEFINTSTIVLGLLLIGGGVVLANLGQIIMAVHRG